MPETLANGFRVGGVGVRPAECSLEIDGACIRIEPKAMDVLVALATAEPAVVSREALVRRVWPRGFVTDDVLNRCISNLRRALGDDARSPKYIVTVPRKGYRMAQPVLPASLDGGGRLLVLPFQDLSAGQEDFVADALTELLIARLSVALDQPVISRTTAMTFRGAAGRLQEIGRQLGTRWFVEGSVLRLGGQVQVVVQLIDGDSDTHLWAETWTRETGDLLSVLNEVSRLVAARVRSELTHDEARVPSAHRLPGDLLREYLHGVQLNSQRTHDSLRRAIACFQRVLDSSPNHAPSLSGMAGSYFLLAHYGGLPPADGFETCRRLAEQALEIEPELADTRTHLAALNFHYDWDLPLAERRVRAVLERNANLEMAWLVLANVEQVRMRGEVALGCMDRALELDPLNTGLLMNSGDHLILQRRYGEAASALRSAVDINGGFVPAWLRLSLALALGGEGEQAREALQRAKRLKGENPSYLEYLAIVEGHSGRPERARRAAVRLERSPDGDRPVLPWSLARAWASTDDPERAIPYLQRALQSRSSSIPFLAITPVFDPIREHEDVQGVIRDSGIGVASV